jgi:hypothetical protein
MTTLAMITAPAGMGLSLHHGEVGAGIALVFLVMLFRAMGKK